MNRTTINRVLAGLVASAVVAFAIAAYLVTRPVAVSVVRGAATGAIQGNLTNLNGSAQLIEANLSATSYVRHAGFPDSTLTLRLETYTHFSRGPGVNPYLGGAIATVVHLTVVGRFTSDLVPSRLSLTGNQTGSVDEWGMDSFNEQASARTGSNVSLDQMMGFQGTSSMTDTGSFGGRTAAGPSYDFSLFTEFLIEGSPGHPRAIGFRVIVDGSFAPSVSAEAVLVFVDVPL